MDLLGSILDTMEKPPQTTSKQEALMKSRKQLFYLYVLMIITLYVYLI